VIFVVEDDTQNGLDHVNGHRSIFLAISPWVKREYVGKLHYSLSSIFKTVDLILGIPPLNQYDMAATDLRDLFTSTPNYTPYMLTPVIYAKRANETWLAMTKGLISAAPIPTRFGSGLRFSRAKACPAVPSSRRRLGDTESAVEQDLVAQKYPPMISQYLTRPEVQKTTISDDSALKPPAPSTILCARRSSSIPA